MSSSLILQLRLIFHLLFSLLIGFSIKKVIWKWGLLNTCFSSTPSLLHTSAMTPLPQVIASATHSLESMYFMCHSILCLEQLYLCHTHIPLPRVTVPLLLSSLYIFLPISRQPPFIHSWKYIFNKMMTNVNYPSLYIHNIYDEINH